MLFWLGVGLGVFAWGVVIAAVIVYALWGDPMSTYGKTGGKDTLRVG